jgi:hypothetical protein
VVLDDRGKHGQSEPSIARERPVIDEIRSARRCRFPRELIATDRSALHEGYRRGRTDGGAVRPRPGTAGLGYPAGPEQTDRPSTSRQGWSNAVGVAVTLPDWLGHRASRA